MQRSLQKPSMYNRLFTKILDSSIWLEPVETRVVWITLLAAMDQDGFAAFASPANVARRAAVSLKDAETAIECFLSPDPNSADPDNEGRRVARVPGGYLVLNAKKYREIFNQSIQREQNRIRVARHRAKVTNSNGDVTVEKCDVRQSEAEAEAEAKEKHLLPATAESAESPPVHGERHRKPTTRDPLLEAIVTATGGNVSETTKSAWGAAASALKQIREVTPDLTVEEIYRRATNYRVRCPEWKGSPTALAKHWSTIKHSGRELV